MTDPDLVWVGPDAKVARDVEILPLTFLYGKTSVGEGSIIGPNTRLTDTVVGRGCTVDETIAIDEAVELAKEFSTDDSGAFVHGVLARVARTA